jgi:hypothetical protein
VFLQITQRVRNVRCCKDRMDSRSALEPRVHVMVQRYLMFTHLTRHDDCERSQSAPCAQRAASGLTYGCDARNIRVRGSLRTVRPTQRKHSV